MLPVLLGGLGFYADYSIAILQTLLSSDSPIPTELLVGVHDFIVTQG